MTANSVTARLLDINDHQESAERRRQRTVRQTTETFQRLKRVVVLWTKLEKHEKERRYQGQIQEFLKEGVDLVAVIYSITNFLFSNEII